MYKQWLCTVISLLIFYTNYKILVWNHFETIKFGAFKEIVLRKLHALCIKELQCCLLDKLSGALKLQFLVLVTSRNRTIHLTPFYRETDYCHGGMRVRVSVWVRVRERVWVRVIVGVRKKWKSLERWNVSRWKVQHQIRHTTNFSVQSKDLYIFAEEMSLYLKTHNTVLFTQCYISLF